MSGYYKPNLTEFLPKEIWENSLSASLFVLMWRHKISKNNDVITDIKNIDT